MRARVGHQVLRHKHDEHVLRRPAACEMAVRLVRVGVGVGVRVRVRVGVRVRVRGRRGVRVRGWRCGGAPQRCWRGKLGRAAAR